jgi:uncharacterized protein YqiB (DUF1249 family)
MTALKPAPASRVRALRYPWLSGMLTCCRPSVGSLMALCEDNYAVIKRLVPDLAALRGELRSEGPGGIDLHLEIIEQARYTTLLRLTYLFPYDDGRIHRVPQADPDALLRAYHDARQVEVIDLRQTALPLHNHYQSPALDAKWKANLFIAKWLGYCVLLGHRFCASPDVPEGPPASDAGTPCPSAGADQAGGNQTELRLPNALNLTR